MTLEEALAPRTSWTTCCRVAWLNGCTRGAWGARSDAANVTSALTAAANRHRESRPCVPNRSFTALAQLLAFSREWFAAWAARGEGFTDRRGVSRCDE